MIYKFKSGDLVYCFKSVLYPNKVCKVVRAVKLPLTVDDPTYEIDYIGIPVQTYWSESALKLILSADHPQYSKLKDILFI